MFLDSRKIQIRFEFEQCEILWIGCCPKKGELRMVNPIRNVGTGCCTKFATKPATKMWLR